MLLKDSQNPYNSLSKLDALKELNIKLSILNLLDYQNLSLKKKNLSL
jgi:hypothetical protein